MLDYAKLLQNASDVVVHDYIKLEEGGGEDPEGFNMSSKKWPRGPLQAMLNTPSPPTSAQHAVQLFEKGLASHPHHPQAHVWCAQVARICGASDLEQARSYCIQSIGLKKSSDGYYVLGHILLLQGYTKEAHLAATTAYEIDPWRAKVQHTLRLTQTSLVDPVSMLGAHMATSVATGQKWCAQCDPICPTPMATPPPTLFQCGRCGNASYCSKACQHKAWKYHKLYCESPTKIQSILGGTSEAHARVLDGWKLPSLADVAHVFGPSRDIRHHYFDPPTGATVLDPVEYKRRAAIANASDAGYTEIQSLADGTVTAFRSVVLQLDPSSSSTELGYSLDAYRAARAAFHNGQNRSWDAYCDTVLLKKQVYVFLTEDYLDALATYLQQRLKDYGGGEIVEIGAGNGRLAYFLQQRGVQVVATDDCSWKLDSQEDAASAKKGQPTVEIHNLACHEALSTFAPSIVLCAWMPMYKDFTTAFCATPSVREYILIGPTKACGHAHDTWGFMGQNEEEQPVYAQRGFQRTSLVELEKLQLCKTDKPTEMFAAQTISFRAP